MLYHLVEVQEKTQEAEDFDDTVTEVWAHRTKLKARITPLRGEELLIATQLNTGVTHRIMARWQSGITPRMRLVFADRTFEIINAVNVDEANATLQLTCKEIA